MNIAIDKVVISPRDKEILASLLERYLPNTAVWAYGSRVTGESRPWSDLDLVVFTRPEQKYQLSLLKEALEESNLSFRLDLLEWDRLPDNFKTTISAFHTELIPLPLY